MTQNTEMKALIERLEAAQFGWINVGLVMVGAAFTAFPLAAIHAPALATTFGAALGAGLAAMASVIDVVRERRRIIASASLKARSV